MLKVFSFIILPPAKRTTHPTRDINNLNTPRHPPNLKWFMFGTMNEIDFRQLRRQERRNARARITQPVSNKSCGNKNKPDDHEDRQSYEPYGTLLTQKLDESNRIHPPQTQIDSVYYAKHYLGDETCQEILDWLQTLPEYSGQSKLSEEEESRECNGKWTTLKHARRKGVCKRLYVHASNLLIRRSALTIFHR